MDAIKQSIIVLLVSGFMSVAPGIVYADLAQDCIKICTDQKAGDDANCQGSGQGADQGRAQCLKSNQDIYNDCMKNCTPGSPPAATAPQTPNPQTPAPKGAVPQTTGPQETTPSQGATPPKTY